MKTEITILTDQFVLNIDDDDQLIGLVLSPEEMHLLDEQVRKALEKYRSNHLVGGIRETAI